MQRQTKIGIIVWLFLLMIALAVSVSQRLTRIADATVLGVLLIALLGCSLYKIRLWWRHRDDPAKREVISSSTQLYPEGLRRFFMDEEIEKQTKAQKRQ